MLMLLYNIAVQTIDAKWLQRSLKGPIMTITAEEHLSSIAEGVVPFVLADDCPGGMAYVAKHLAAHPATKHNRGTTILAVLMPAWESGLEALQAAILACNVRDLATPSN